MRPDSNEESDQGCRRRPKTKYEIGTTPAELTSATTAAHTRFRPRIWLAGRRLISMSAATRRAPSVTAAAMSSLRVRALRSLHCGLVMTSSQACLCSAVSWSVVSRVCANVWDVAELDQTLRARQLSRDGLAVGSDKRCGYVNRNDSSSLASTASGLRTCLVSACCCVPDRPRVRWRCRQSCCQR